jgi:hypothetical protein
MPVMDVAGPFEQLWQWIQGHLPGPVAALPAWAQIGGAICIVLVALFVALFMLMAAFRLLFGRKAKPKEPNLEEDLGTYPPAPSSGGDRRLVVEGVPVRLRLVALAPAGKQSVIDGEKIEGLLDQILPGLGHISRYDRPRVRIWPMQLSYQGFTKHFHRNTLVPEPEGELSPWIVVAGRAKLGKNQVMVGLALQALKPTTVGRLTLEAHEWESKLRVRVRD